MSAAQPTPDPAARPAATVVVVREPGFEVLLLRRSDVGAFAGMWVFPGGRVDDDDLGDDELGRAASAAVREAREEVGLRLAADSLTVWSHWTPPAIAPRRFATWFFLAPWAGDDVEIDGHEIVEYRWLHPSAALAAELPMAPPTIVTLHELAQFGSFHHARQRCDPPAYVTRPARTADGMSVLLWAGDSGYDSGDADLPGPRNRLWMLDGPTGGRYRYERT